MRKRIVEFYKQSNLPKPIVSSNLRKFEQNDDIAEEFERWLTDKSFKTVDAVTIEGYTAKRISELSPFMNGDSAFLLLIELRNNPHKALKMIANGFKKR